MKTINGKILANDLNNKLKDKIKALKEIHNVIPKLVVILIGENLASKVYVKNKSIKAGQLGIISKIKQLDITVSEKELLKLISFYNQDVEVYGILLQLPIPQHINS